MSRVVATEFVTLDGVMEAPGGEPSHPHTGWVADHFSAELEAYKFGEVAAAGALLMGRVTYESHHEGWTDRTGPFAERMSAMPKIVVSSTLRDPRWANTTVVGDASSLPEVDGDLLLVGSATLLHELLDRDLVDELRLMTFPVSIGGGLRVFGDARHRTAWRRVETTSLPNDVRLDRYERTAMSSGPS